MMEEKYVAIAKTDVGSVRFASGMTVYDEKLINGKLTGRYLNACGQIMPEMHLPESSADDMAVFQLHTADMSCGDRWTEKAVCTENGLCRQTLENRDAPVTVTVCTKADGTGWLSRSLEIQNTGDAFLPVTWVAPFSGRIWRHCFERDNLSYAPEECGLTVKTLYDVGYCVCDRWGTEGDFRFESLNGQPLIYDGGMNGRSGWSRPAFTLRDNMNGQLFCCELAYSGNWEMRIAPDEKGLAFAIGLKAPEGECVRVLAPGEKVCTPEVHFTLTASGAEALMHARHRFVRESVMPQNDPIGKCLVEANHRGYLCDRESEDAILRDVEVAASVGAELYVIDAGWFGKEPNVWYHNAGDWFAGPWLPHDLYPIIRRVRELGMKFGLWMEIEAAGENTDVRRKHPEFIMRRNGVPCADGRAIDLSNPQAAAWVQQQIESVITRYDLDMFRIDHNHWLNEGGNRQIGGYTEDVFWLYFENFYEMFRQLNRKFPNVSFQNCAAGGGRLDLGILRYFHHTEVTDWVRPPRGYKQFSGLLTQLPPEIQLRTFGTEVSEHVQDGDILSQLHNVMQSRMIFRGIAPAEELLAPPLKAQIRSRLTLYREHLRPILTGNCRVYRSAEACGVLSPCRWICNEFALPDGSAAFAVVQKTVPGGERVFPLRFRGLRCEKKYRVWLDRAGESLTATGSQLMLQGIDLYMEDHLLSELVTAEAE